MTAEAFRREHSLSSLTAGLVVFKQAFGDISKWFGYAVVLSAYVSIFILSIATLSLIEIRRANLKDFDALIAILEQQERYFTNGRFEQVLTGLAKDIDQYRRLEASLPCSDKPSDLFTGQTGTIGPIFQTANRATSTGQNGGAEILPGGQGNCRSAVVRIVVAARQFDIRESNTSQILR